MANETARQEAAYVQHLALQLLVGACKMNWNKHWGDQQKASIKQLLTEILHGQTGEELKNGRTVVLNLRAAPKYVKSKFAEAFVEVMKREWPQRWPDCLNLLLNNNQNEN